MELCWWMGSFYRKNGFINDACIHLVVFKISYFLMELFKKYPIKPSKNKL